MNIHTDTTKRVELAIEGLDWIPSPLPGVERRMLARRGGEVAIATSVVRYAPGSRFEAHTHGKGEEFFVLEGIFSDENGDYPAGTYVRNPPGSSHAPYSAEGCTIFVKLRQMSVDETKRTVVDTRSDDGWEQSESPKIETLMLHSDKRETVQIERWAPGARAVDHLRGGAELLVLHGSVVDEGEGNVLREGTWLRVPGGARLRLRSDNGARFWIKRQHVGNAAVDALGR